MFNFNLDNVNITMYCVNSLIKAYLFIMLSKKRLKVFPLCILMHLNKLFTTKK